MSCHPGELGSSASPPSPELRTWTMRGGGRAARACSRMQTRLTCTVSEAGTPIGGGSSMDFWTSRRRRTLRDAQTMACAWLLRMMVAWSRGGGVDNWLLGLDDILSL